MILKNCVAIFIVVCVICNNGVEAFHRIYPHLQSASTRSVSKLHRTGYHFQPNRNWINGKLTFLIVS